MADMVSTKTYEEYIKEWDNFLEFMRKNGLDNGFYRNGDFITNDGVTGYYLPGLYEDSKKQTSFRMQFIF